MKLWVLVGLQNEATNAVAQAETLFNDAVHRLDQIANEIVAAYPQYFQGYIDSMGVQTFRWASCWEKPNFTYFDPDDDESKWGYWDNNEDAAFHRFPDELIEAIRIYRRVQRELHKLDHHTYG